MITSIRVEAGTPLRASSIQNLQTAIALAGQGHRVLLWVARLERGGLRALEEILGRPFPAGLRLLAYRPGGGRDEKKTPFSGLAGRLWNLTRARLAAPPPDAILTRSPRIIGQMRNAECGMRNIFMGGKSPKLILEYQYPEWAQLWREWRRRNPKAPLREAVGRLRAWRRAEDGWLAQADGILYAALGHRRLLERAAPRVPARLLPSGCLPPNEEESEDRLRLRLRLRETSTTNTGSDGLPEYELGYVGSLAPENGLECLLEALAALPDARLLCVGGGRPAYVEALQLLAADLGVASRVEWAGAVPFREVRGQMRRCRVGVVPIGRRQGPEKRQFASPLKLVEWMGAGVPVVASAVPSAAPLARDGENCLLAAPDDPAALAEAAKRLLEEPELTARLAQAGRAAAAELAWPNRAKTIVDFIGG